MAFGMNQLSGISGIASGIGGLFGNNKNPYDAAKPYIDNMGKEAGKYFNPYMQAGEGAIKPLQDQYSQLLGDPGKRLNDMGKNYQQSPGFQFALEQALGANNRSAAAGGMAGSAASNQNAMATATGLASQDYNNWMQNTLGLYNQGLSGQQGMMNNGLSASKSMSDLIAQQMAQQANMAYGSQNYENQNSPWANVGKIAGGAASIFS